MTVEEIFNKLATHMYQGVIYHDTMAKAYNFLGLWGFFKCHIHQSQEEKEGYTLLSHYYSLHYFKLLQLEETNIPKLIPDSWYKYSTQAIDSGTKRNAVKELMEKWVEWEQSTKKFYQEMRQELCSIGEFAAALFLDHYINDVTKELSHAQKKLIKLETVGYDIIKIIEWQEDLDKKYTKKLGW